MHSSMLGSIARRGLEAHAHFSMENSQYKMPKWAIAMLAITAALYLFVQFMIEYTYGRVIPTLLMIESPPDTITFEPIPVDDGDPINKYAAAPLRQPFLTSSFRASIRLLRSKGGFRSRFRGISVFAVNLMAINFTSNIVGSFVFFPKSLVAIVATVLCANLSLAWTHIVISEPSQKTWVHRVSRSTKVWRKVALPTMVLAVAQQVTILAPMHLAFALMGPQINNPNLPYHGSKCALGLKALSVFVLALTLSIVLVIPANVTLTRVQASLLDDNEETIVPFDRSFGGKVVPEIVGGTGVISMRDAWTTFDWNARKRLLVAYVKVFAMQLAVTIFFTSVFVVQICLVVGKDWNKLVPQDPPQGKDSF